VTPTRRAVSLLTKSRPERSRTSPSVFNFRLWREGELKEGQSQFGFAPVVQTSTCSAIARASSTSIPRYLTVLSIFVCPNSSCTARKLPVRR